MPALLSNSAGNQVSLASVSTNASMAGVTDSSRFGLQATTLTLKGLIQFTVLGCAGSGNRHRPAARQSTSGKYPVPSSGVTQTITSTCSRSSQLKWDVINSPIKSIRSPTSIFTNSADLTTPKTPLCSCNFTVAGGGNRLLKIRISFRRSELFTLAITFSLCRVAEIQPSRPSNHEAYHQNAATETASFFAAGNSEFAFFGL
jgi:hypothetical protein